MANSDEFDRYMGCRGVWVIYGYDNGPYPLSMHRTSDHAVAELQMGYGIAFWMLDQSFKEAIEKWEKRKE